MFDTALSNIQKCDIILADIRYLERENTGTAAELMYAWTLNKRIIGWYTHTDIKLPRRVFMNALVKEQYNGLQEALDAIKL
jgi:nucleoside 2-deoxyribosyltransferase